MVIYSIKRRQKIGKGLEKNLFLGKIANGFLYEADGTFTKIEILISKVICMAAYATGMNILNASFAVISKQRIKKF